MKVNLFKDVSRELEPIRNKIVRRRRLPFWTARITGIQNTFCKREVAGHWRRPHLNWSGQRSSITLQSMRTVLLYPNRSVLNGRLTRTGFQRKFPTQLLRTVRWKKLGLLRNTKIHHSTTCLKRGGWLAYHFGALFRFPPSPPREYQYTETSNSRLNLGHFLKYLIDHAIALGRGTKSALRGKTVWKIAGNPLAATNLPSLKTVLQLGVPIGLVTIQQIALGLSK